MSALVLVFAASWWALRGPAPAKASSPASPAAAATDEPARLKVSVLSVRPHDRQAYTQGLLIEGGALYESTGLYGQSSLRQLDPKTGEVKRRLNLPQSFFAEGIALVGDKLVQLTWQEGSAFVYSLAGFERTAEHRYRGEGWGLCYDGRRLVMSDGSDQLTFRDPQTFAILGNVRVTLAGDPIHQLNELECVEGAVYANVWQTNDILRIDPSTGKVTAVIDASGLLSASEQDNAEVLNGIAYDPAAGTFLITGKLWPKMFEVKFVPR